MMTRVIDYLKQRGVTALFTSLTEALQAEVQGATGVSSLMDTWVSLRQFESDGNRKRLLHILKSRGMSHSSQSRVFRLTDKGVQLEEELA